MSTMHDLLGFTDYRYQLLDFVLTAADRTVPAVAKKSHLDTSGEPTRQTWDQSVMPKTTAPEHLLRRISVGGLP